MSNFFSILFEWLLNQGLYYLAVFVSGCIIGGFFTYLVFIPALKIKYKQEYKKRYTIKEATINCKYSNFNPYNYKTNVKLQDNKIIWLDCECLDLNKRCANTQSPYNNKPCPYSKHIKYL